MHENRAPTHFAQQELFGCLIKEGYDVPGKQPHPPLSLPLQLFILRHYVYNKPQRDLCFPSSFFLFAFWEG